MKEIIIIIIIIFIICTGTFYINLYLKITTTKLIDNLEDLKNSLKQENEHDILTVKSEKIYEEWKKINKNWSNIILHSEIDAIETALIRLKSKIEEERYDEVLEEVNTSIFLISHIKEKEKTSLKNIF